MIPIPRDAVPFDGCQQCGKAPCECVTPYVGQKTPLSGNPVYKDKFVWDLAPRPGDFIDDETRAAFESREPG